MTIRVVELACGCVLVCEISEYRAAVVDVGRNCSLSLKLKQLAKFGKQDAHTSMVSLLTHYEMQGLEEILGPEISFFP